MGRTWDLGSDHTASTTIWKKIFHFDSFTSTSSKNIIFVTQEIYLFNNLLRIFLSRMKLLSLKFLFKHFYSKCSHFQRCFQRMFAIPSPLPENNSFSKTLTPTPVLISNVRMPEWIFLVTSWRYALYLTRLALEHNRYNEIFQPTPLPLINPFFFFSSATGVTVF